MALFVDVVEVEVKAGNGGNGCVSFHREKFVQAGGPDGGDGGRGGDVVFVATQRMHTLMDFRFKRKFFAENGADGQNGRCRGKSGEDMVIEAPCGTIVRDSQSGKVLLDLFADGERKVLLRGGNGGFGNARFATPTRQAPNFAKPGEKTQPRKVRLELKSIADVGLVAFEEAADHVAHGGDRGGVADDADGPLRGHGLVLAVVGAAVVEGPLLAASLHEVEAAAGAGRFGARFGLGVVGGVIEVGVIGVGVDFLGGLLTAIGTLIYLAVVSADVGRGLLAGFLIVAIAFTTVLGTAIGTDVTFLAAAVVIRIVCVLVASRVSAPVAASVLTHTLLRRPVD